MTRQCMRPGCDRRASACLTYDADTSAVWLEDPVDVDEPAQVVCSLHAETLTVPLGWTVTDRRSAQGTPAVAVVAEPPERAPLPEPLPEPLVEQDATPSPAAKETTDGEAPAGAPSPQPSKSRPNARRNKLLDRAFEWTGPQHSVLTTRPPDAGADGEDDTVD